MDHEKLLEFNKLVSQTSDFCCNKLKYSNYTMKFYHKCWDKIYELMLKHNISVIDDDSVSILLKKIGYYKKGNRHVATNIYYLSRSLKMLLLYKKTNSVPLVLNDSQNDLLIPFSNYLKDFLIYLKLKQRRNNITISAYKRNIIDYMKEYKLMNLERANEPLFFNSRGERFTRQNIAYILIKYANMVRKECPELIPEKISPHIFRHSKAMHLLQAGVNIVYIRDFMGHVSINTTEIYAKADSKMKREAIENAYVKLTDDKVPKWENNENLLSWLENL